MACHATAREVQAEVLDCVAALAWLNVDLAFERAWHREQSPRSWETLFDAVCARLTHMACDATAREVQAEVLDCVAALARLNVDLASERACHREHKPQTRSALADPSSRALQVG